MHSDSNIGSRNRLVKQAMYILSTWRMILCEIVYKCCCGDLPLSVLGIIGEFIECGPIITYTVKSLIWDAP